MKKKYTHCLLPLSYPSLSLSLPLFFLNWISCEEDENKKHNETNEEHKALLFKVKRLTNCKLLLKQFVLKYKNFKKKKIFNFAFS